MRNQPQPSASPPTTSVTQCTPRRARLVATATAMTTAPAASHARVSRPAVASEHQDDSGPGGGSRGRVTRRERRPGRLDELHHVRAVTVDDQLEQVVDQQLTDADGGDEGEHLDIAPTHVVDHRRREERGHDHPGPAEVGDHLEHIDGRRGGVLGSPFGDAVVELGETGAGVDHVEQEAEDDGDDDHDQEGDGEHEPAASSPVEALVEEPVEPRVSRQRPNDSPLLGRWVDRVEASRRRPDERDHTSDDSEEDDDRSETHPCSPVPVGDVVHTPLTASGAAFRIGDLLATLLASTRTWLSW